MRMVPGSQQQHPPRVALARSSTCRCWSAILRACFAVQVQRRPLPRSRPALRRCQRTVVAPRQGPAQVSDNRCAMPVALHGWANTCMTGAVVAPANLTAGCVVQRQLHVRMTSSLAAVKHTSHFRAASSTPFCQGQQGNSPIAAACAAVPPASLPKPALPERGLSTPSPPSLHPQPSTPLPGIGQPRQRTLQPIAELSPSQQRPTASDAIASQNPSMVSEQRQQQQAVSQPGSLPMRSPSAGYPRGACTMWGIGYGERGAELGLGA